MQEMIMTEYEMASLANEYREIIGTASSMAFTTVSAFLVAGYLAAHKLNRFMIVTVVTIYTVWLGGAVATIVRTATNIDGLFQQMHLMAVQGKGLQWHWAANTMTPWSFPVTLGATIFVFAVIYIASVVFFFQLRHQNRKAEMGVAAPKA
jgi:hypothetical protein